MAIRPEERRENIFGSIQQYLNANYVLTAIQWPGVDFNINAVQEWIKPDLIVGDGPFYRQVGGGLLGKQLIMLYNINIFGKIGYIRSGNSFRLLRIQDTIRNVFRENTAIPVRDYVTGGAVPPVIGTIDCFNFTEQDMGEDIDISAFQRNVTIDMRYTEKFETPV